VVAVMDGVSLETLATWHGCEAFAHLIGAINLKVWVGGKQCIQLRFVAVVIVHVGNNHGKNIGSASHFRGVKTRVNDDALTGFGEF
jgi:hypothetical protein